MPAVIEMRDLRYRILASGGPATAPVVPERSVEHDFDRERLRRLLPPYKVVVHNNDYNTFEEVDALSRGLDEVKRVFRRVIERPQ